MISPKKALLTALVTTACIAALSGCNSTKGLQGWFFDRPATSETEKILAEVQEYRVTYAASELEPTPKTFSKNAGSLVAVASKEYVAEAELIKDSVTAIKEGRSLTNDQISEMLEESDSKTVVLDDGFVTSFKINSYYLREKQRDAIYQAVQEAMEDGVTKIVIYGYASPEGPYNWNKVLSKGRAVATAKFISDNFNSLKVEVDEVVGDEFLKDRASRAYFYK